MEKIYSGVELLSEPPIPLTSLSKGTIPISESTIVKLKPLEAVLPNASETVLYKS